MTRVRTSFTYFVRVISLTFQVKSLLAACTQDYGGGGCWYYRITSRRMRNKEVQVIPWAIEDSNYVKCHFQPIDSQKTVFVGALHGMLNAEGIDGRKLTLRGEVVIFRRDFVALNKKVIESGGEPFANPRNAASGWLRLMDSREAAARPLRAFFYDLVEPYYATHGEVLDAIEGGFEQGAPTQDAAILLGNRSPSDGPGELPKTHAIPSGKDERPGIG